MPDKTHFGYQQVPEDEKAKRVGEVFSSVAPSYDLMNDLMSLGLHRLWKTFTVQLSRVRAGERVLDVASGSGDLARAFAARGAEVCMSDINGAMLSRGRDRLLDAGRSVLLQPYLERVDAYGETALIHFDGVFSHAIRKGPLLRRGDGPTEALFAAEDITPRVASEAERALAQHAVAAIPFVTPLPYARVDLIHDADGTPRLLELELAEPSLFFAHGEGSALRFARILVARATR